MNILYREIIYRIIKIDRNEKYTHTNRSFRIHNPREDSKKKIGFLNLFEYGWTMLDF